MVDRRPKIGGHWNDAYPFVRLHQPSSFYGVASRPLGRHQLDETAKWLIACRLDGFSHQISNISEDDHKKINQLKRFSQHAKSAVENLFLVLLIRYVHNGVVFFV